MPNPWHVLLIERRHDPRDPEPQRIEQIGDIRTERSELMDQGGDVVMAVGARTDLGLATGPARGLPAIDVVEKETPAHLHGVLGYGVTALDARLLRDREGRVVLGAGQHPHAVPAAGKGPRHLRTAELIAADPFGRIEIRNDQNSKSGQSAIARVLSLDAAHGARNEGGLSGRRTVLLGAQAPTLRDELFQRREPRRQAAGSRSCSLRSPRAALRSLRATRRYPRAMP